MIDLDAIKAEGRNTEERSAELMRMYVWARRVKLSGELLRQAFAGERPMADFWAIACERVPMPEWVAA